MRSLPIAAGLALCGALSAAAQETTAAHQTGHLARVTPAEVQWVPAPAALPPGAQIAVLEGDPSQPATFTMRVRFPDGYRIQPHTHSGVERVTVLSGTLLLGMGATFDAATMTELPAGSFATTPPGMQHYGMTRGETILQINTVGPWTLNYVNPADDPRNRSGN
jgi:quercetin dioxygenase-like cupin family protein